MQNKSSILSRFVPVEVQVPQLPGEIQEFHLLGNAILKPNRYNKIPKSVSPGLYCSAAEEKDYNGLSRDKAKKKLENNRTKKYKK